MTRTLTIVVSVLVLAWLAFTVPALAALPAGDGSWSWQLPLPQGKTLHAVDFASGTTGLAAGESGTVMRTTDGGGTWARTHVGQTSLRLSDVSMPTSTLAWVVGTDDYSAVPTIKSSTDGGATWTAQDPGFEHGYLSVLACGTDGGWAAGWDRDALRPVIVRRDGAVWARAVTEVTSGRYSDVAATGDGLTGWVVGNERVGRVTRPLLLHTADGGATWSRQRAGFARGWITSVATTDGIHAWAVGTDLDRPNWPVLMRTTDGGATWSGTVRKSGDWLFLSGVSALTFPDDDHGYGLCWYQDYEAQLISTSDGGAHWRILKCPELYSEEGLSDLCFTDPNHGQICGPGGYLGSSADAGRSWTVKAGYLTDHYGHWGDSATDAVDPSTAWAIVRGNVLSTADGGATWLPHEIDPTVATYPENLSFVTADVGWLQCFLEPDFEAGLLHTTDGGATWRPQETPIDLLFMDFVDESVGWISAYGGGGSPSLISYKTANGGTTWQRQRLGLAGMTLFCLDFVDPLHGWAVVRSADQKYFVATSSDGGATWSLQPRGLPEGLRPEYVTALDARHGWVTGYDDSMGVLTIAASADSGTTWAVHSLPAGLMVLDAPRFVDEAHGWLECFWRDDVNPLSNYAEPGQDPQAVLRTVDGGATWNGALLEATAPAFVDPDTGWAIDRYSGILATTTGGWAETDVSAPVAWSDWTSRDRSGWRRSPVEVQISAMDMGRSGLKSLAWRVDGGPTGNEHVAVVEAPADHSNDGVHALAYTATDSAGNTADARTVQVKIDTTRPTARVARRSSVVEGGKAGIDYVLRDRQPCGANGSVRVRILNRHGRLALQRRVQGVGIGDRRTLAFRCNLKPGRYTVRVVGRDTAGNATMRAAKGVLVVR